MAYLESIQSQLVLLLRSAGCGFLIGIGYELVRFVRLLLCPGRSGVPWDIACGAASGLVVFLYALIFDDGRLRAYMLFALLAGGGVWYVLCAAALRQMGDRLLCALYAVRRRFTRPIAAAEQRAARFAAAGAVKLRKSLKKTEKNEKSS